MSENKRNDSLDKYKDAILQRYDHLTEQIKVILEKLEITNSVCINTDLLQLSVCDYFEDIDRLKDFHDIDRANVNKIYSYGIFWMLRRSPIQIIDPSLGQEYTYINEKVCVAIIFSKMIVEIGVAAKKDEQTRKRIENFIELLYYNFRYRTYTQQSLELMVEAFFCGCCSFESQGDL